MRAMQLERPAGISHSPLRAVDAPEPNAGEGEIVIDVSACAVCRTDLQIVEGDVTARKLPIVPGHQLVGRVAAIGAGVGGWKAGNRAGAAWLASACGSCTRCTEGRENLSRRSSSRDGTVTAVTRSAFRRARRLRAPPPRWIRRPRGGPPALRSGRHWIPRAQNQRRASGAEARALRIRCVRAPFAPSRAPLGLPRLRLHALGGRAAAGAIFGAESAGGYDRRSPNSWTPRSRSRRSATLVVSALRALNRGGTVAVNAIHLDEVPRFSYDHLWWERSVRSVSNFTRPEARELPRLAAKIPLRTSYDAYNLADANVALARLKEGRVTRSGRLHVGRRSGAGISAARSDPTVLRDVMEENLIPVQQLLRLLAPLLTRERVRLEVPFRDCLVGDAVRPALHGGVLSALADAAGGAAVWVSLDDERARNSTIDLRIDYLRRPTSSSWSPKRRS